MGAGLLVVLSASGCGGSAGGTSSVNDSVGDTTDNDSDTATDSQMIQNGTDTAADTNDADSTTTAGEVFANVTGVAASGDPGAYTFDVTISSADLDCSQYADWWEVLKPSGELVYRRILAHSHTEANSTGNPFTRSGGPVAVMEDDQVIVRAHMNTVGYKGMIMSGAVAEGFAEATDLADDFARDIETAEPQPTGCAF